MRSIRIRAAVIMVLPLLVAGCFFNLSEKKDFKHWYYGDPGMAGALGEENCDRYADNIQGERHPYYLHFRTPEILLQPQGGAHYPERTTAESLEGGKRDAESRCEQVAKGWETFRFDAVDAGLVDVLIPYRSASAVNDHERGFGQGSLAYSKGVVYNTGLTAVMKAPVYIVHDILKTLYIPVAGTYYLFKPDAPPETSSEIIQVRGGPPTEDRPLTVADSAAPSDGDAQGDQPSASAPPADTTPVPAAADAGDRETGAATTGPTVGEDRPVTVARTEPGGPGSDLPPEAAADSAGDAAESTSPESAPGYEIAAPGATDAETAAGADPTGAMPPASPAAAVEEYVQSPLAEKPAMEGDASSVPPADMPAGAVAPVPDEVDPEAAEPQSPADGHDTTIVAQSEPGTASEGTPFESRDDRPRDAGKTVAGKDAELSAQEDAGAGRVKGPAPATASAQGEIAETEMPSGTPATARPETDAGDQDDQAAETPNEAESIRASEGGDTQATGDQTAPIPEAAAPDDTIPAVGAATDAETPAMPETGGAGETPAMDATASAAAEPERVTSTTVPSSTDRSPGDGSEAPSPDAPVPDPMTPAGQIPPEADQPPRLTDDNGPPSPLPPDPEISDETVAVPAGDTTPAGPEATAPDGEAAAPIAVAPPAGPIGEKAPEMPMDRAMTEDGDIQSGTQTATDMDASGTTAATTDGAGATERSSDGSEAEDSVGAAAAALGAIARGEEGPASDPSPALVEESGGEIVEEDLLTAAPSGDGHTDAADIPDHPDEALPAAAGETSDSMVSVSPDQQAVSPDSPAALEPIDRVRVAKRSLRKRVAFIGFHSRSPNIDEKTKAHLQDQIWPVFEDECHKNLVLVRQGDAGYPSALDTLMRDQFGHMNSFELTTVARFSGLNAIIAGTIIDIRVSKELGGILWYKSPEGQLRLTILVEVFDAETGTKLFDHTYIREEEVEELEPGSDEKLRDEDLPVLNAALQSVVDEMGDDVCDALEDQPWRAFVSGIKGNRIALSSGQDAGLEPGNVLGVYNSQIIDGLNNQQFFLTGEKVGRIQIINVSANRSEALLIEGRGLRDYSVAIPE